MPCTRTFGERHFWAPEVYKVEGGYAMCYSAEEHVLFAFAKSPLGPFVQEEKKPLFDFKAIDGSIFRDDDGRVWLFFVKVENGNVIYQVEMERDLRKCRPETMRKVFGATEKWELRNPNCHVAEGPFVVKVDGATSPRETIPAPIIAEDLASNPVIRAPNPQPINFVNTAITVNAKMNQI